MDLKDVLPDTAYAPLPVGDAAPLALDAYLFHMPTSISMSMSGIVTTAFESPELAGLGVVAMSRDRLLGVLRRLFRGLEEDLRYALCGAAIHDKWGARQWADIDALAATLYQLAHDRETARQAIEYRLLTLLRSQRSDLAQRWLTLAVKPWRLEANLDFWIDGLKSVRASLDVLGRGDTVTIKDKRGCAKPTANHIRGCVPLPM